MKLTFKPKVVTGSLLIALEDRARDIIERRFGLTGKSGERMTLEAIGNVYGITRERVRQIENFAVKTIRKSDNFNKATDAFSELVDIMTEYGGLVHESDFLEQLAKDKSTQNHIHFLLTLSDSFFRLKENDDFYHRWTIDNEASSKIENSLGNLHRELNKDDLISENEVILRFVRHLESELSQVVEEERARRWLSLSKNVASNPLGEWGLASSPNIHTRGMRDFAYLVLRNSGEPMHFSEVASQIESTFNKKAHIATTHNELIKDDRFVLVGRGLYALSEWGYSNGVVRDVIKSVIEKNGALSKKEVVDEVMKQRQVKENTIYVNLQNPKYFKKNKEGKYALA